MNENVPFSEFLAARIKEKGLTPKKLADITGIAASHIESLLRGDYTEMPSTPYFRGYIMRIGKALEFDGETWWQKVRAEGEVKSSEHSDELPHNRFIKQAPPKYLWTGIVGAIILVYVLIQLPRILGTPSLSVSFPSTSPYTATENTLTITGNVSHADSLSLNGDPVTINPDGSWQKGVLLQNGLNTFQLNAKKFLGGETSMVEQVYYEAPILPVATSTPTSTTPTSTQSGK